VVNADAVDAVCPSPTTGFDLGLNISPCFGGHLRFGVHSRRGGTLLLHRVYALFGA
jgi:hypothetical protein